MDSKNVKYSFNNSPYDIALSLSGSQWIQSLDGTTVYHRAHACTHTHAPSVTPSLESQILLPAWVKKVTGYKLEPRGNQHAKHVPRIKPGAAMQQC